MNETKDMKSNEKREMELAGILGEMICLGWTPKTFDADFDVYTADEDSDIDPSEKETCREIFKNLWDYEMNSAPTTCILRGAFLSDIRITDAILNAYPEKVNEEEVNKLFDRIVEEVNNQLPGYLVWYPHTSEIIGTTMEEFSEEEFNEILDRVYDKVIS